MAYYQDEYDKKFIKKVREIIAEKHNHKLFKTQNELSNMLGLGDKGNTLSAIIAGHRGVPKDQREAIDKILREKFTISRSKPQLNELQEPATVYGMQQIPASYLHEQISTLKDYNGFIKTMFEQNVKNIQISLEMVAENQKLLMRQVNAEGILAAQRFAGGDQEVLNNELHKRDKLIVAGLE